MDKAFGIIGTALLVLLFIILFAVLLVFVICLSHPKIVLKYKDKLEISTKLWFFKFNITKFLSRKRKKKSPKVLHFDGTGFGELAPKTSKKAAHPEKTVQKKSVKSGEKIRKPFSETASEILELITDILSDISDPFKKVLRVDVKKLYVTVASEDAHKTAILFGNANTALGSLIYVCEDFASIDIDKENTGVYSDFCSDKTKADVCIVLTLSLRHTVICVFKALKRFINR